MIKKIIVAIFITILISINFALAQLQPYFSVRKGNGGFVVGVEIIDPKNKKIIDPSLYNYRWLFPNLSINPLQTKTNLLFIKLDKAFSDLLINLKINQLSTKKVYNLESRINLPQPVAKIVRKHKGIVLPLDTLLNQEDSVSVLFDNFSGENIQFMWDLDGTFVSNEKEVPVNVLPAKSGFLKVQVFGYSPREKAVDSKYIKIE